MDYWTREKILRQEEQDARDAKAAAEAKAKADAAAEAAHKADLRDKNQ